MNNDFGAIAKEEIATAVSRWPDCTRQLTAAIEILHPRQLLQGSAAAVYRSHVRELLERVATGHMLAPATLAECLMHLSSVSLAHPLNDQSAALMERLFAEVFGGRAAQSLPGTTFNEPWPRASDQVLAKLRRNLKCSRRAVLDPPRRKAPRKRQNDNEPGRFAR